MTDRNLSFQISKVIVVVLCTILSLQVQAGSLSEPTDSILTTAKPLPKISKKPIKPLAIPALQRTRFSKVGETDQPIILTREVPSNLQPAYKPSFEKEFNFSFNQNSSEGSHDLVYEYDNNPVDSIAYFVNRAHSLFDEITKNDRFKNLINAEVTQDLPMGIKKNVAGYEYVVMIDSIYFTPERSFIVAYVSLPVPTTDVKLAFRGVIPFTKSGGITGVAQISLLEDVPVNLTSKVGLKFLAGAGGTYIEFDCNGFVSMSIDAEVEFSTDLIKPENEDGTIIPDQLAKAYLSVSDMEGWHSFVTAVTMDPFQVTGMDGWGFAVQNAVFDFSEVANHGAVVFPDGYESVDFIGQNQNNWTGVFIESVSLRLPPQFNNHEDRTTIEAQFLLIDKEGFTGTITGNNVLSIGEGSASGWAFSVDQMQIEFYKNTLTAGSFNGDFVLPIDKKQAGVHYQATITNADYYSLTASYNDDMETDLWGAYLTIDRSSSLTVTVDQGKFLPSANLSGNLAINQSIGEGSSSKIKLPNVNFQNLELATVGRKVKIGTIEFLGENDFSNFPITITPVGVANYENGEIGLKFDATVNFAGGGDSGFGGNGRFELVTRQKDDDQAGLIRYEYVTTRVERIAVNVDQGAFTLNGQVDFFRQNEVYGKGFQGSISATFEPGLSLDVVALFGNTGEYRYWFVDGKVVFPGPGIVVFPGFALYGFGGGAYHHMRQDGYAASNGFEIGKSISGLKYVPDRAVFMGLKATVVFGTSPSRDAFTGDATLELVFNSNWGLNRVTFTGYGEFATSPVPVSTDALTANVSDIGAGGEDPAPKSEAQVVANVLLDYNISQKTLHGNLSVYMNVAGGLIKGAGAGGLAGEAELHFAPGDWWIYIGHPDRRVGVVFTGLFQMDSYLMIGTKIPNFPDPPAELQAVFGPDAELGMVRDADKIGDGKGFAFGASMSFGTGDLEFLMFYAKFQIGAGFDIMLKQYPDDVRCAGSSESIGINNWYAMGQAYAYITGKVGIKVKLKFYEGNFDIFDVGLAALLQAQLPNPIYMRGMAAGNYNILGGLVKGNCKFEFEIGERCELTGGSPIAGVQVISELTPAANTTDVNVFGTPQAVFNLPVDQRFEFTDVDGAVFVYRINLDRFRVLDEAGNVVQGIEEWSADNEVVAFKSNEVLPPSQDLVFQVGISFEEFKNGAWTAVQEDGQKVVESQSVNFTTGEAPDFIPESNVVHIYPVPNQLHYYPQESPSGYLKLERGQAYLFNHSADWQQKLALTTQSGYSYETNLNYIESAMEVRFNMPTNMPVSTIHGIKLIDKPTITNVAVDANVSEVDNQAYSDNSAEVTFTTNEAEGSIESYETQELYAYHFRTSAYTTFRAKFNAISKSGVWKWPIMVGIHELGININGDELFDYAEGYLHENALVRVEANLSQNVWFQDMVKPLVYQGLNSSGITLSRNEMPLGIPPKYGTLLKMNDYNKLTEGEISANNIGLQPTYGTINYYLPFFMHSDYMDIRYQAANASLQGTSNFIDRILNTSFPSIRHGKYPITIQYVLPGKTAPSSTINYNMDYED